MGIERLGQMSIFGKYVWLKRNKISFSASFKETNVCLRN